MQHLEAVENPSLCLFCCELFHRGRYFVVSKDKNEGPLHSLVSEYLGSNVIISKDNPSLQATYVCRACKTVLLSWKRHKDMEQNFKERLSRSSQTFILTTRHDTVKTESTPVVNVVNKSGTGPVPGGSDASTSSCQPQSSGQETLAKLLPCAGGVTKRPQETAISTERPAVSNKSGTGPVPGGSDPSTSCQPQSSGQETLAKLLQRAREVTKRPQETAIPTERPAVSNKSGTGPVCGGSDPSTSCQPQSSDHQPQETLAKLLQCAGGVTKRPQETAIPTERPAVSNKSGTGPVCGGSDPSTSCQPQSSDQKTLAELLQRARGVIKRPEETPTSTESAWKRVCVENVTRQGYTGAPRVGLVGSVSLIGSDQIKNCSKIINETPIFTQRESRSKVFKYRSLKCMRQVEPAVTALCSGAIQKAVDILCNTPALFCEVRIALSKFINREVAKTVTSPKLAASSCESLFSFDIDEMKEHIEQSAPLLWALLKCAAGKESNYVKVVASACILFQERNQKANRFQQINGLVMHDKLIQKSGMAYLHKIGITTSYETLQRKLREASKFSAEEEQVTEEDIDKSIQDEVNEQQLEEMMEERIYVEMEHDYCG